MDFLDPKKRRAHEIRLLVGYVLVAIAIILATIVLLYSAYGFGLNKGQVVQNGLVFVSSHPGSAAIRIKPDAGGKFVQRGVTNTRLTLQAGTYQMKIDRQGYREWYRTITVEGDSVERFDYPFLFPDSFTTKSMQTFAAAPLQATQSPSRRWLMLETSAAGKFELYDLNTAKKNQLPQSPAAVNLPSSVLTAASTSAPQQLKVIDWSDDNRHVLLEHTYDKTYEYIMLDTQDPSKSLNLNKTLGISAPTTITLQNTKYDHYFVYNPTSQVLSTANLSVPIPQTLLKHVITYETYGSNVVLYTTSQGAPGGQVAVDLYQNNKNYLIRDVTQDEAGDYLLDLTQYSGSWYIVAGSPSENQVYVYQNPLDVLTVQNAGPLVPVAVLKVNDPNYVSFSDSAQFIMAEHANSFAVYDVQYDENYAYTIQDHRLDPPQPHASWMDGDRLTYVSDGSAVVFDYDGTNKQTLVPADPVYLPFFDPAYQYLYTLVPTKATTKTPAETQLTSTALLTAADL